MNEECITLSHRIYTPQAIAQAIHAFQHLCTVEAVGYDEHTDLCIRPTPTLPTSTTDDFLNYVLDLSAQELLTSQS